MVLIFWKSKSWGFTERTCLLFSPGFLKQIQDSKTKIGDITVEGNIVGYNAISDNYMIGNLSTYQSLMAGLLTTVGIYIL